MFPRSLSRPFVGALAVFVLAVFVCASGCRSNTPVGEVSGTVTFEKKPVGEGRITFMNVQTGAADEALLNTDGTYAIKTPLSVGEYKVTVEPLIVRQQVGGKGPVVGVEKPAPNIPDRYRRSGSTDLKATLKEGKNDLPFDMKR